MATPARAITPQLIAGVVVEVNDLASTRLFYDTIFRDIGGQWKEATNSLTFLYGRQRIEFAQVVQPRSSENSGQHQAYCVKSSRLRQLAEELSGAGHSLNWWREDHPAEKTQTAYLDDPSGNRVQLVAAKGDELLLHHAAVEVDDLEPSEPFYINLLGGRIDYYHGLSVDDRLEAKAWADGTDVCAPWTRQMQGAYPGHPDRRRLPRPAVQMFVGFGNTYLGVMLGSNLDRQEPPEEIIKGTPRVILQTSEGVEDLVAHLSSQATPFVQEDRSIFLRDHGGNFIELEPSVH